MYEQAQPELERIITLVKSCPEDFQAKGFELLLHGYVESQLSRRPPEKAKDPATGSNGASGAVAGDDDGAGDVPAELLPRFKNLASWSNVTVDQLQDLFDFKVEPFTFAAIEVEGKNNYEKTRNVALLIGAKNYVANGSWTADWEEIKAHCTDHDCYDMSNFSAAMQKGRGLVFKTVEVGKSVELNNTGKGDAKKLLGKLAGNAAK